MFDFLGDLLGLNKGKATKAAADKNTGIINGYDAQGNAIIDAGSQKAGGYLGQAAGLYDPIKGSTGLYADALGLNGAEGAGRANEAFTTSPGYGFTLDQGLQALDRRRAASGSFQSGGADIDTMTYATGLAGQEHGNWLDRLGGLSNTALAGQTGALNNLANLATGTASQKLGLAGEVASGHMGANNQYAQGEEANKAGIAGFGSNLAKLAFGWGGF